MTKKIGPYIGVTGFMSRTEVIEAIAMIPQEESTRRLMVGVLMNFKTLLGQQNNWPGRYPKKETVSDIFVDDQRTLNLIHYNTDYPEGLFDQLMDIMRLAGPHLDGFQLNIAWPSISQLEDFHKEYPDKFLLLQIGNKAMAKVEWLKQFTELVSMYLPVIDAILLDLSEGRGELLDATKSAEYLEVVRKYPTLGLGVAGGLGPDTLHHIDSLVKEFPMLSIDAEDRLRTPKPEDTLCLDAVRTYLEDGFPILAGKELPGWKLQNYFAPYGFEKHVRQYGSGANMLRTTRLAQPRALKVGDILGTGDKVLSPPREGVNGSVLLHLTGGLNGHWIKVPGRIPIALLTENDNAPEAMWKYGKE